MKFIHALTHDDPAKKVTVLHEGSVLAEGSLADVQANEKVAARGSYLEARGLSRPARRLSRSTRLPKVPMLASTSTTAARTSCAASASRRRLGEVTVVLGRNGVGKTTLLKSLMGVVPVQDRQHRARRRAHRRATRLTSGCAGASATCRRGARSSAA